MLSCKTDGQEFCKLQPDSSHAHRSLIFKDTASILSIEIILVQKLILQNIEFGPKSGLRKESGNQ